MRLRLMLCVAVLGAACLVPGARAADPAPRPTKDVFDDACRSALDSLLQASGLMRLSTVELRLAGGDRTQFFRSTLVDAVAGRAGAVFLDGAHAADTVLSVSIEEAQVGYGAAFRRGWFGEKKTERSVLAAVRLELLHKPSGRIVYAGTVRRTLRDTIAVDEIARLGASSRQIAAGEAPGPSLWERILEPAIVTVSSGIAIYLFFTVRS